MLGICILKKAMNISLACIVLGTRLSSVLIPLYENYNPDPNSDELKQMVDATKQQVNISRHFPTEFPHASYKQTA